MFKTISCLSIVSALLVSAMPNVKAQNAITVVAGNGTAGKSGDNGLATNAQFNQPEFVTFDKGGNMLIADASNHRIRKVDLHGIVTTIAGGDTAGYSGDGGPATKALLNGPQGLAFDAAGNLYFSELENHVIRKITPTGTISTYAGIGYQSGHSGDGGMATSATLSGPCGITFDQQGNLYIAEFFGQVIRKVDKAGKISTIAGVSTVGFSGDGGKAINAMLNGPSGVVFDDKGNLFIADAYNNRVRKIAPSGIITTIAGTGVSGFSGENGPAISASFRSPYGLLFDKAGGLYVSDCWNFCIRNIDSNGLIKTIAGQGEVQGDNANGQAAPSALLGVVCGLAFDKYGHLYVGDSYNNRVYKITNIGTPLSVPSASPALCNSIAIAPTVNDGSFDIMLPQNLESCDLSLVDMSGKLAGQNRIVPRNGHAKAKFSLINGSYTVMCTTNGTTIGYGKIVVQN